MPSYLFMLQAASTIRLTLGNRRGEAIHDWQYSYSLFLLNHLPQLKKVNRKRFLYLLGSILKILICCLSIFVWVLMKVYNIVYIFSIFKIPSISHFFLLLLFNFYLYLFICFLIYFLGFYKIKISFSCPIKDKDIIFHSILLLSRCL